MSDSNGSPDSTPPRAPASAPSTSVAEATPPSPPPSGSEAAIPPSVARAIKDEWAGRPAMEVELIHELRSPPYVDQPWRMLELWTQNRIYAMDLHMRCLDVIDQKDQRSVPDHELLGARLVGGQLRDGDIVHLSHPFPRPGTNAVFTDMVGKEARFSQTSAVKRVVLRLRHVTIGSGSKVPSWDEIGGISRPGSSADDS